MQIYTHQPSIKKLVSITTLDTLDTFRLYKHNQTIEKDIINQELYIKCRTNTDVTSYFQVGQDYGFVHRTGPIMAYKVKASITITIDDSEKEYCFLNECTYGDVVRYYNEDISTSYIIVNDPIETKKRTTLINLVSGAVTKVDSDVLVYLLKAALVLDK